MLFLWLQRYVTENYGAKGYEFSSEDTLVKHWSAKFWSPKGFETVQTEQAERCIER